ncbi:hypothetical protein F2Q69_00019834 [Brassica cretica]|uniref:Uncharacterized protein n=1 Tax=Brassica cretica TaxID=69181 RepID=A0A8S9QBK9_BRACR|nr:hypothetical protein F2Q69_00019834 [Brassica cretica]
MTPDSKSRSLPSSPPTILCFGIQKSPFVISDDPSVRHSEVSLRRLQRSFGSASRSLPSSSPTILRFGIQKSPFVVSDDPLVWHLEASLRRLRRSFGSAFRSLHSSYPTISQFGIPKASLRHSRPFGSSFIQSSGSSSADRPSRSSVRLHECCSLHFNELSFVVIAVSRTMMPSIDDSTTKMQSFADSTTTMPSIADSTTTIPSTTTTKRPISSTKHGI